MITVDGSFGEGGGQILRTALALALVTGQPFRIEKIRAGRKNPGLLRQHLTAVKAAAQIGQATIAGDSIGSTQLTFAPGRIAAGEYTFAVGTAGSTTLVLQTILPALLRANAPSRLTLEGGTHNPFAPPFHFLVQAFLPLLNQMLAGGQVTASI
jgi:RNA 3'-terminal phosphate cyclase (ATP)